MNSINLLNLGLDGSYKRQEALSNNIANVNTPDYKRKDVDFLSTLRKKAKNDNKKLNLKKTSKKHIHKTGSGSRANFQITTQSGTSFKNDGNNVDIDVEMTELAKNNIYYNTLVNQISKKFSGLKNVISKGGN